MTRYDVAIIGSGPAGLEAAINLKIRNKRFILFGSEQLSHKLAAAERVDNYLGIPATSGKALQARFKEHLAQMDIQINPQQIQMIYAMGDHFALTSSRENFEATAVILATGISHAKPFPGEEAFLGRGVSYCATCDAPLYRGKTVAVLGYTDEAVHEANFIAELATKVYYIPMAEGYEDLDAAIEVVPGKVRGIEGEATVKRLVLEDGPLAVDGVFVLREAVSPSALMPGIEIREGYIHVQADMSTSIPGCFAAGDCTGKPHQFMRAAGQGQTAALSAVTYVTHAKHRAAAEKHHQTT